MKLFLLTFLSLLACALASEDFAQWQEFKAKHNKPYTNHVEDSQRFAIFQSNLRLIKEHNAKYEAGESSYYMGVNQFADLTEEEFKSMLGRSYNKAPLFEATTPFKEPINANVPDSLDWRTVGAVTRAKNQGECAGCWAFATVGVIESLYYLKYKKVANFSEQQIIDCTQGYDYPTFGCEGGFTDPAFRYVIDNGIETEQDYPFIEKTGVCNYDKSAVVTKISSVAPVPARNATALKNVLATYGPATIAIYMGNTRFYKGGIYEDPACAPGRWVLNHAMVAIGYGAEKGTDFWTLKNSFGPNYGENGFIRIKRGENSCGVEQQPYYAVM